MAFVVLVSGLLAFVSCLPTSYLHNISLTYDGSQLNNLNTIDTWTDVDPGMASSLKGAIMTAWPDYLSFLNGNTVTTSMSPESAAFFNQPDLVNFHVDINTLPPNGPGAAFSPDAPSTGSIDGQVPPEMTTTMSSLRFEGSSPLSVLPGGVDETDTTFPVFVTTTVVPVTVTPPPLLPPAVLNSTADPNIVIPPVDAGASAGPNSAQPLIGTTTMAPLPSPDLLSGTTLPIDDATTLAPLGMSTTTMSPLQADQATTAMLGDTSTVPTLEQTSPSLPGL